MGLSMLQPQHGRSIVWLEEAELRSAGRFTSILMLTDVCHSRRLL